MSAGSQLEKQEIAVLKACYDYSLKEETDFITIEEAIQDLIDAGLSEDDIQESLDDLLGHRLLEEYAGSKGSGEIHTVKATVYGFVAYAKLFLPDIDKIYNGTLDAIVNEGLQTDKAIAKHLAQPKMIIDYMIDILKHKGLINAIQFMGTDADYKITQVSTEAKKAARNLRSEKQAESSEDKTVDESDISIKEDKRNRVLLRVYRECGGNPFKAVSDDVIVEKEGVSHKELMNEIQPYLQTRGLIKYLGFKATSIDQAGIDKVEQELLRRPENTPTPHLATERKVDLSFIADDRIRPIMERDYKELQQLDPHKTPKAVLVLSGAIIEGLLFDAIVENGTWTFDEACNRPFKDMIYPAKTAGMISHDNITDVLRVFRNLVHIAREVRDKMDFNETHAEHALTSVEVIISEIRAWHQKRKAATP